MWLLSCACDDSASVWPADDRVFRRFSVHLFFHKHTDSSHNVLGTREASLSLITCWWDLFTRLAVCPLLLLKTLVVISHFTCEMLPCGKESPLICQVLKEAFPLWQFNKASPKGTEQDDTVLLTARSENKEVIYMCLSSQLQCGVWSGLLRAVVTSAFVLVPGAKSGGLSFFRVRMTVEMNRARSTQRRSQSVVLLSLLLFTTRAFVLLSERDEQEPL